jgi:glycerophosphoryl diester phosphodiesterase
VRIERTARGPLRIGHRGAAALGPANSLAAIEAALSAGLDGIELDVVEAERRLRLAHSRRELDAQSASLDEALTKIAARTTDEFLVHLDLKTPGCEAALVGTLRECGLVERAIVSSTNIDSLRACRRLEPRLTLGFSYPRDRLGIGPAIPDAIVRAALTVLAVPLPFRIGRWLRASDADVVMLHHYTLTVPTMRRCRALGAPVFAWTVNDPSAVRRVEALGVHAVITDAPAIFDVPVAAPGPGARVG